MSIQSTWRYFGVESGALRQAFQKLVFQPHRFSIPTEYPPQEIAEAVNESRDVARRGRGLERTNVRDGPPAAASRKIHRRHVIKRNVAKKFVRTKTQTLILGCGRTHREC